MTKIEIYERLIKDIVDERDALKEQIKQHQKNEKQYYDHLVDDLGYDPISLHVKVYQK